MSVSKEKGGIRVWPIHCIKSMTVITIITPQFALGESCSEPLTIAHYENPPQEPGNAKPMLSQLT